MTLKPEPDVNPNGARVDPPGLLRVLISRRLSKGLKPEQRAKRRAKAEAARVKSGLGHTIEYFHQYVDPYSHLAQQTLETL